MSSVFWCFGVDEVPFVNAPYVPYVECLNPTVLVEDPRRRKCDRCELQKKQKEEEEEEKR